MVKKLTTVSLFVALAVIIVLAAAAGQQGTTPQQPAKDNTQEMVVCPVSGEQVVKSQAPASWEYKGKTYYFCCEGCKAKFMKDPESFLQKKPAAQAQPETAMGSPAHQGMMTHGQGVMAMGAQTTQGMAGMMGDRPMRHRMMRGPMAAPGMGCPMMGLWPKIAKDVEFKVDYTKDGAVVTLTSKNPDTVKIIQGHAAMMKTRWQSAGEGQVIKKEVIIKEQPKKEPAQK